MLHTKITGSTDPESLLILENELGRVSIEVFLSSILDTRLENSVLGPCSHIRVQAFVLIRRENFG